MRVQADKALAGFRYAMARVVENGKRIMAFEAMALSDPRRAAEDVTGCWARFEFYRAAAVMVGTGLLRFARGNAPDVETPVLRAACEIMREEDPVFPSDGECDRIERELKALESALKGQIQRAGA